MLDRMLENRGVQMVLQNLIKAAAPELTATVQQVATLIENFDSRLKAVEIRQVQILEILQGREKDNGRTEQIAGADLPGNNSTAGTNRA